MLMRFLEDLRFFIGTFFVIVGGILAVAGLLRPELTEGVNLNLSVGLAFGLFGLGALAIAYRAVRR